jgi:hypothetical protein
MQQKMIWKPFTHCLFIGLLLLSSSIIQASEQRCTGSITDIWVHRDGSVYISGTWRDAHTKICNLATTWKGVSPNTCKSWQKLAQRAHATQKTIILEYSNLSFSFSACKRIPTYDKAPSPNFVMLHQ